MTLDRSALFSFVNKEIVYFHQNRLKRLDELSLDEVLHKKNPYLFRAKNLNFAGDLIRAILDAFLSLSEEKIFGDFLESLAIFVSQETCDGKKSSAEGIDLEFDNEGCRYLVAVKSGPNWGNSSQYKQQEENFRHAVTVQKQARHNLNIQPVLGICYGKGAATDKGIYQKIIGQSFWHFLSGDSQLYIDIIEPIGHEAKRHNEDFLRQRAIIENKFTAQFLHQFCKNDYSIDWEKLIEFNSGNMAKKVVSSRPKNPDA